MILHRYLGSHLEDTVLNQRLKASKPSQFNDPFEFRFKALDDVSGDKLDYYLENIPQQNIEAYCAGAKRELSPEQVIEGIKKQYPDWKNKLPNDLYAIAKNISKKAQTNSEKAFRVICFNDPIKVKPMDEILLWSHYTNNHSGARIEIDTDFLKKDSPLREVKRINYPPALTQISTVDLALNKTTALVDTMISKAKQWAYEQEVRCFPLLEQTICLTTPDGLIELVDLPIQAVRRIDFGIRFDRTRRDDLVTRLRLDNHSHINFRQATCSEVEYKIEYIEVH